MRSEQEESDKGWTEDSVEPPICTEKFTFLPGCCAKLSACGNCDSTKTEIKRQSSAAKTKATRQSSVTKTKVKHPSNAELAAKALTINISAANVSNCWYCCIAYTLTDSLFVYTGKDQSL